MLSNVSRPHFIPSCCANVDYWIAHWEGPLNKEASRALLPSCVCSTALAAYLKLVPPGSAGMHTMYKVLCSIPCTKVLFMTVTGVTWQASAFTTALLHWLILFYILAWLLIIHRAVRKSCMKTKMTHFSTLLFISTKNVSWRQCITFEVHWIAFCTCKKLLLW